MGSSKARCSSIFGAKKRRGDGPLRPVVGEGDLARVRAAELALLAEEDLGGRMERDAEGRLVPALLAERETFQKQLNLDRGRPLSQGAHAPPGIAPFAELSGSGHAPPDESEDLAEAGARFAARGKYAMSGEGQDANAPFDPETGGKARAMRNGGILGPLQTAVTMGRRRAPTKRSKGAALDADIGRLKREANRLEKESAAIRAEMAADMQEVELLEADAERLEAEAEDRAKKQKHRSAEDIQRAERGAAARREARDRARKIRDDVARAEVRAIELEQAHAARRREAKLREAERLALARLLEAVLEDCRSFRAAAKLATTRIALDDGTIPPDAIYNVNVYHDCGRVFFSAYDSSTSTALVESVHERDVDKLLAPNSIEHRAHAAKMPPRSLAEMYSRLVQLLVVNRGTAQALTSKADPAKADTVLHRIVKPRVRVQQKVTPPRLMCRRKLNRLLRETRRISEGAPTAGCDERG